jgi:hypothetical protein
MNSDNIQSIARAILVASGAWLVNNGYVSAAQWQSVVGAILALGAVAWSIYSNRQTRAANAVAAVTGNPVVVPLIGVPTVADHAPAPTGAADVAKAKAA